MSGTTETILPPSMVLPERESEPTVDADGLGSLQGSNGNGTVGRAHTDTGRGSIEALVQWPPPAWPAKLNGTPVPFAPPLFVTRIPGPSPPPSADSRHAGLLSPESVFYDSKRYIENIGATAYRGSQVFNVDRARFNERLKQSLAFFASHELPPDVRRSIEMGEGTSCLDDRGRIHLSLWREGVRIGEVLVNSENGNAMYSRDIAGQKEIRRRIEQRAAVKAADDREQAKAVARAERLGARMDRYDTAGNVAKKVKITAAVGGMVTAAFFSPPLIETIAPILSQGVEAHETWLRTAITASAAGVVAGLSLMAQATFGWSYDRTWKRWMGARRKIRH